MNIDVPAVLVLPHSTTPISPFWKVVDTYTCTTEKNKHLNLDALSAHDGIRGWGIYDWGIYSLDWWGSYGIGSYCFLGGYAQLPTCDQTANIWNSGSLWCHLGGASWEAYSLMVGAPVPETRSLVIQFCTAVSLSW